MSTPVSLKREGVILDGSPASVQPVGSFKAGTVIQLFCRYAEFVSNGTTNPNNLATEGPYLRIYPAAPPAQVSSPMTRAGEGLTFRKAGVETAIDIPQDEGNDGSGVYWEIDAKGQKPVFLPFDCSLVLATEKAGFFVFDYVSWHEPDYNGDRWYPQTRILRNGIYPAGGVSRTLWVPRGASEYELTGYIDATNLVHPQQEDSVAAVSDFYDWYGYATAVIGNSAKPTQGARRINISCPNNPPSNGGNVAVIFHCHI